ncbi:FliH/SctL family protein [uncultured Ferrimonas sp.]|uniref:FliH/SctL family protein n=1 Tax=uncultured Ferrimonas sp. TaxID=432640 RepID=UPI002606CB85|nr:FliH/SctL family protein [uncultured Ferrimonas sp.]
MSQARWRLSHTQARHHRFSTLNGEQHSQWQSHEDACEQGYQQGLLQGQQQGQQQGRDEGVQQGLIEGRAKGHSEGYAEGQAQAQQQLEQLLLPLNALKAQLDTAHQQQLAQQQQVIVALVQQVCDKVIRQELQLQPRRIIPLLEDTIATLPSGASDIEVRLHPSSQKALAALPELAAWRLVADPELTLGDLLVSSNVSEADASAALRLQACIDKLAEHLIGDGA